MNIWVTGHPTAERWDASEIDPELCARMPQNRAPFEFSPINMARKRRVRPDYIIKNDPPKLDIKRY